MPHADGTAGAMLEFFDYVAERGLMNKSTAAARKSASTKILSIDEGWEAIDLGSLDLDEHVARFHTLRKSEYAPNSLTTYESRFRSGVDEYLRWLSDPSSFKAPSRQNRTNGRSRREGDAAGNGTEDGGSIATDEPRTHPRPPGTSTPTLVSGLIERLPAEENAWTEDELEEWLQLAALILRTVYVRREDSSGRG